MAIGTDNNKLFEPTYYSRLSIKSPDGNLALSPSFRSGLLILEISEHKEGFKWEGIQSISISPTKATILANEIRNFKKYYENDTIIPGKGYGIVGGMNDKISFIAFSATAEKDIIVTIGKMNGSSGDIIERVDMPLHREYHYGLEWNNIETMDVAKNFIDDIEINQLETLCDDFGRSMLGAFGYSVADISRYDTNRLTKKFDPIFDKLGIERRTNNSSNYNNNGSSFLNSRGSTSNSSSTHTSIEGIEDQLYDED